VAEVARRKAVDSQPEPIAFIDLGVVGAPPSDCVHQAEAPRIEIELENPKRFSSSVGY